MSHEIPGKVPFWIDWPNELRLDYPVDQVWGWVGATDTGEPLRVLCDGFPLPVARVSRPDLAHRPYVGFSLFLDFPDLHEKGLKRGMDLTLRILQGDSPLGEATLPVSDRVWPLCQQIAENRRQKAGFIARHAKRPLHQMEGCRAPSALPKSWPISPRLADKSDIASAHFYGGVIRRFLDSLSPDAMVLDAGAGLRRLPGRNVVNMDIYDYPSTDVLGVGQDLPFLDDTFDAVLSIAVLEHVDDPFTCAEELVRVTKPGGKILSMIPFLQAEHGYPSHYANFTRFGVRALFKKGTELESHFLERANHPVFVLNQIIGLYAAGLPQPTRDEFLKMKVGDFLAQSPDAYINQKAPIVEALAEDVRWVIAAGTTAIVRKL